MTRAVIVGSGGQDGRLLFDALTKERASIVGLERTGLRTQGVDNVGPDSIDILNGSQVAALLEKFRPDEVYYLAAHHAPAEQVQASPSPESWHKSFDVHVHGLLRFLEAIRQCSPTTRLFYACSALVFGPTSAQCQNEDTAVDPRSPYAITKAAGWQCCRMYRDRWSVFASVGILYNHESHLRPPRYVSQKIVQAALRIRAGQQQELVLGDLTAQVDWGSAADFVRAMSAILRLPEPDDFVVATGTTHTVADMARVAFDSVNLDWKDYVREQPDLIAEARPVLVGDASKLRAMTGWEPTTSFEEIVRGMVAEQLAEAGSPVGRLR